MLRHISPSTAYKFIAINIRRMCSSNSNKLSDSKVHNKSPTEDNKDSFKLPDEPDNCCMSGCENCVWMQYAKELTELYKDSGSTAKQIILKKISDPSMLVFLKMELDSIDSKKSLFDSIQTKPVKKK